MVFPSQEQPRITSQSNTHQQCDRSTFTRAIDSGSYPVGIIEFDEVLLKADNAIIAGFPINPAYSEYAYGKWGTRMVYNGSGNKDDGLSVEYQGHAQLTEYGQQLRYLPPLIGDLFEIEHLKSARIFSASDGGFIVPHRDYLEFKHGFRRLHIPLQTYDYCLNSEADIVYHMECGEIWFLDGTIPHSGGCFGPGQRLHLVLDFDPGVPMPDLFKDHSRFMSIREPTPIPRRLMTNEELQSLLSLGSVMTECNFQDFMYLVAKLHFDRHLSCASTYDLLAEIAVRSGHGRLVARALELKRYFLGTVVTATN